MGIVNSTFDAIYLCMDRVSNWALCACILSAVMWMMMLLIIYGMTIGYHTGQKGLVEFSLKARGIKRVLKYEGPLREANTTDIERRAMLELEVTTTISDPKESQLSVSNDASYILTETPAFMQFKDLPGTVESIRAEVFPSRRYRRSKNHMLNTPFWRPLKKSD